MRPHLANDSKGTGTHLAKISGTGMRVRPGMGKRQSRLIDRLVTPDAAAIDLDALIAWSDPIWIRRHG